MGGRIGGLGKPRDARLFDPTARRVWVPDLGLDRIVAYQFDGQKGLLTPSDPPAVSTAPGAGPLDASDPRRLDCGDRMARQD